MSDQPPLLEVRGLRVERGGTAILGIPSLSLASGSVLALIGPNGAGKSTLLVHLAGLETPTAGEVLCHGRAITLDILGYRRRLAMVFQDSLLFDTTVERNVAAGLAYRGLGGEERERRVAAALERFRIVHLRRRSARTLSGGEAQRTSLARAFALEPEVVFLDEPFASLDPPTREALLADLEATLRETGTTAVLATHDRLEALRLADRLAVMREGAIVQEGTPVEVMHRPADEFVASFVGMETLLEGRVVGIARGASRIRVGTAEVTAAAELPAGSRVLLGIRPEQVILTAGAVAGRSSARNALPGTVTRIIPLQAHHRILLDCGFPLSSWVTTGALEDLDLGEGSPVTASFKATAVHVLRRL